MIWAPQNSKDPNRDYMGDHYFLVFFGRRRPSKPRNQQITTGDRYFLAFLEWEITIFLFFLGGDPRNPKICKSQREITIFLLFWSGKLLFSCFFWRRRPSKPKISDFRVSRVVASKKKQENSDFPLQKSKKIVISRCDLQISGF